MAFEKIYIGKGKFTQVKSVQCTITKEMFDKHAYAYNGEMMLTFEVAEMKQPDQYGKTHTIYINKRVDNLAPIKHNNIEPEDSDLPF